MFVGIFLQIVLNGSPWVFYAIHLDIGRLVHSRLAGPQLVVHGIFFFNATYIVSKKNGWGELQQIPSPSFDNRERQVLDTTTMECFQRRTNLDVHSAMKCTYNLHRANLSWFM